MSGFLICLLTAFAIAVGFGLANYHATVGAVVVGSVGALIGLQLAYLATVLAIG